MAKAGRSTGRKAAPSANESSGGSGTLRSLRHAAASNSPAGASKGGKKVRSTASLSVAEKIAKRAAKPLVKGNNFRFVAPSDRLSKMKVDLEGVRDRREMLEGEEDAEADDMHTLFGHALQQSQLINLSLPFVRFSKRVEPYSRSLPLVLHYRRELIEAACQVLTGPAKEVELCGESVLDLLPPLITDISHFALPSLPLLLTTLIRLTTPSPFNAANPRILQRVYDVLGALFRDLARDVLLASAESDEGGLSAVWQIVRRGLGAPPPPQEDEAAEMQVDAPQEGLADSGSDDEGAAAEENDGEKIEVIGEEPVASTSARQLDGPTPGPKLHSVLPAQFRTTPQTRRLLGNAFALLVRKAKPTSLDDAESASTGTLDGLMRLMIGDVANVEEMDDGMRANGGRGAKGRRKGKGKGRGQEEGSSNIFAEGVTWVVIESCTAPNCFFHSRTPSILRALFHAVTDLPRLVDLHLPTEIISHAYVTLTSHAEKLNLLEPVVETALKTVEAELRTLETASPVAWERVTVPLQALSSHAGVKAGARLPPAHKPRVFATLASFSRLLASAPPDPFLHALTDFLATTLPLAVLSDVLASSVRGVIEAFFAEKSSDAVFAAGCSLASTLDEVQWPLWDTAFGATILGATARELSAPRDLKGKAEANDNSAFALASKRENSRALLARLAGTGRLQSVTDKGGAAVLPWEKRIGALAASTIDGWRDIYAGEPSVPEELSLELVDVLRIAPFLPQQRQLLLPALIDLAAQITKTPSADARVAYLVSPINPAQILGSILAAVVGIASRSKNTPPAVETLSASVEAIISNFAWHRQVMHGLSALSLARIASDQSAETREAVYSSILPNLLSEDSVLRRSALEIALSLYPAHETPTAADLISKCIEAEDMPLSVQGAREKSMKVRRLGIVANGQLGKEGSSEPVEPVLEIILRYLTAMLKVNFKPIWPEATGALALLAERFPEQVWAATLRQLLAASTLGADLYVTRKPDWAVRPPDAGAEVELVFDEQTLRDWHLEDRRAKLRASETRFRLSEAEDRPQVAELIVSQITPERLVVSSYEAQLLSLYCQIPDLAQKHSREFVDVFLGCFQRDDVIPDKADEVPVYFNPNETSKDRKARLLAWLALFAKFSNPKALYRARDLDSQFRTLLAFPDAEIQKLALECILRWKVPSVTANAERLKNLLESTKLRDELLQFVSSTDAGGLEPKDRADVVPLVIRITYGLMISRLGRASASSGQGRAGRRAAILGALRTCTPGELDVLVDLLLGPLRKLLLSGDSETFELASTPPRVPGKRQLGFLGLLADVVKHLGKDIVHRWPDLLGVVTNLLHFAQRGIDDSAQAREALAEDPDEEEGHEVDEDDDAPETQHAPLRHIRQTALKRFTDFFNLEVDFDYRPYLRAAFPSFISPRLPNLPGENAQAPSALLELFVTWSKRRDLIPFLVDFDSTLLPSLYRTLTVRNVKPTVVLRIFDLVSSIVEFSEEDGGRQSTIGKEIVQPGVDVLLEQLGGLIAATASTFDAKGEIAQRQIGLLCSLAVYIDSREQATQFLVLGAPLLRKPNKVVPEKIKTDLLKIVTALYSLARPPPGSELYDRCCDTVAALFMSARSRNARLQLVAVFNAIASADPTYSTAAALVSDLNSYSAKRSEEPDFDRRLAAFSRLNEEEYQTLRPADWVVLLHNMLFFVQDAEELSIRSNASYALRRFVEVSGTNSDPAVQTILTRVFLPGIRNVLRSKNELIRSEVLAVLGYAVEKVEGVSELEQLRVLLFDGDEEANFFNNILHIQNHRRTRALRRLADAVEAGNITSKTIADIFLPLIDHFVADPDEKKDPDLVNETVQCFGRLAKHLGWSAYTKVAYQYLKLAKAGGAVQKGCLRTLVSVLKSFHFDLEASAQQLESTTTRLIPQLLACLEKRDDTDQEVRIPVAEGIAAVIQHVPGEAKHVQETALLMALAQTLRSRDQHVRDLVRVTLVNIVAANGGDILGRAVKELRKALARGPQLHVLAFTVHALLVRLSEQPDGVDFDHALDEIVPVLDADIFGTPAKDRTSQEFRAKTKFREVRSFKSLDSFQLLARVISPVRIAALLSPLRGVLSSTDSAKALKDVEEVFKVLATGLTANTALDAIGTLELCHSLISQNASFLKSVKTVRKNGKAAPDYHVQLERDVAGERDYYSKNAYRFVSFGLEVFNAGFRKSVFDLNSPQVLSRMEPLVALVGNTLYSEDPVVLARGMRATASLIRCPLGSTDQAAPVLVKQMLSVVERSGSTESELAQSALRTLSTVLRDCKTATLSEKQLTSLLEVVGPDLEEADRQATLFQVLRAVMARKFVAPEIYDLMNKVAEMLVTNQSGHVREVCRAIYLQFLLDYPQGRGRLRDSLAFLAKNLSYEYESGRLSVLELVSAILQKFAEQLVKEAADLFFVALVMVIANDDSTRCREMAGELVKLLFSRIDKGTRDTLLAMLNSWAGQKAQPQLARTAIQLFGVAVDALGADGRAAAPGIVDILLDVLVDSEQKLEEAEQNGEAVEEVERAWQLPYQALQASAHVYRVFPDQVSPDDKQHQSLWKAVRGHLLYPHLWVRTSSSRLLGTLFAASQGAIGNSELPERHPLATANLLDMAQKSCLQLKSPALDEGLAMQIVKNLFFAAKCFAARGSDGCDDQHVDGEESDDEDGDEAGEKAADGDAERKADPLRWLFTRLSFQARQAHTHRPSMYSQDAGQWSRQPATILRWFAAVISFLSANTLQRFVIQMANPIFRISEDPNAQDPQMAELQTLAREVQELLQAKIGTTAYSQVHNQIRQKAAMRRQERKQTLAQQAIADPAEDAKRKAKRAELRKAQKKKRTAAFAAQKERFGEGSKRRRTEG